MASKVTIGLIGCGVWGKSILHELLFLDADVCVVDPAPGSRADAIKIGASEAFASIGELPRVNGIIIATPSSTHAAIAEEALGLKVPVFLESPFSLDLESATRLAEAAPDSLFIMHLWRYHVGVGLLASLAASEELGRVEWLRLSRTHWNHHHPDTDAIWSLLPHDLSIALEILGHLPQPSFALPELNRESVAGVLAVLGDSPRLVIENSCRYSDNRTEVRLHCAAGVAVLPDISSTYIEITRDLPLDESPVAEPERKNFSPGQPLTSQLEAFLSHLASRRNDKPRSTAAEGLLIVETVTKVRRLAGLD